MRGLDWPRALGLIPHLAAAETMDIEGTEMGPDWRRGEGGSEGARERGWKRRMKVCDRGREIWVITVEGKE